MHRFGWRLWGRGRATWGAAFAPDALQLSGQLLMENPMLGLPFGDSEGSTTHKNRDGLGPRGCFFLSFFLGGVALTTSTRIDGLMD